LSRSAECENDPERAHRTNVEVTAMLAELAADIPFVFFSTDLVFDGSKGRYVEGDAVHPLSVYGASKAEAEGVVLRNAQHTVIRTSLNAGLSPGGQRAFNEELRRAWEQGKTPALFTDEFRSPIAAEVTARAVWAIVSQGLTGLFHLAGSERLSRYRIGELLSARWPQLQPKLRVASLKEYQGAPRPPDTSLDSCRLEAALGWHLPGFTAWLEAHREELI
jgi:dTDP-4-dehydrorhamnose reductase